MHFLLSCLIALRLSRAHLNNPSIAQSHQLLGDFIPQTSYRGSAPGPRWGTSVSQNPCNWPPTSSFSRSAPVSADYQSAFAEAALDFRFDHFIVIGPNISIGQKFAVDKMKMAKTAVSHSGSEARGPAQARGPGQGPTSPMPRVV